MTESSNSDSPASPDGGSPHADQSGRSTVQSRTAIIRCLVLLLLAAALGFAVVAGIPTKKDSLEVVAAASQVKPQAPTTEKPNNWDCVWSLFGFAGNSGPTSSGVPVAPAPPPPAEEHVGGQELSDKPASGATKGETPMNPKMDSTSAHSCTISSLWTIAGRVLDRGEGVENALVWAIVNTKCGQQLAPNSTMTDQNGDFKISFTGSGCNSISDLQSANAVIQATKTTRGWFHWMDSKQEGRCAISIDDRVLSKKYEHAKATWSLGLIASWFIVCFVLALSAPTLQSKYVKLNYKTSVFLTFGSSMAIILAFYFAIEDLVKDPSATNGEVVTLGFANIYRGQFSDTRSPELIVSLGMPPRVFPESDPSCSDVKNSSVMRPIPEASLNSGTTSVDPNSPTRRPIEDASFNSGEFGAPLWVIVLSVLGASLLTVTILLEEIGSPVDFTNLQTLYSKRRALAQQQISILFAPLGGIFIFQALLTAGAADKPLTVAIAAFGAGATTNVLLTRAVNAARNVLNADQSKSNDLKPGHENGPPAGKVEEKPAT